MKIWIILFIALLGLALLAGAVFLTRFLTLRAVGRNMESFQNDLITRQVSEVENLYRQIRGMRHDLHNHAQTMQAFLELGQMEELREYLQKLGAGISQVDQVLRTGNVMADAILNSKLSLAESHKLAVHAKAVVPEKSAVPDVALCTILGNLLDNAMEACLRVEDPGERFIRLYISPMKGQLYISVTNSAPGKAKKENGKFLSSKPDRDRRARHGFGLMQIDRAVKQMGGFINRQQEEGVFATEVMLPL